MTHAFSAFQPFPCTCSTKKPHPYTLFSDNTGTQCQHSLLHVCDPKGRICMSLALIERS